VPFGYLVSYLPYDAGRALTAPDIERRPLSSLVGTTGHPVVAAEQTLEPILADPELAAHLELPVGAALLLVERRFLNRRRAPVYLTRGFYRGARYRYIETVTLRRHPGAEHRPGD
jgi:GntR family transcriptional regulator